MRSHAVGHHVQRAALHAAGEQASILAWASAGAIQCCSGRRHPSVAGADEGQVLDARDVRGIGAVQIAARELAGFRGAVLSWRPTATIKKSSVSRGRWRARCRAMPIAPSRRPWPRRWVLALARSHALIVEAGTGTGKTFAYLVPALLSGRSVIISTGTRTCRISSIAATCRCWRRRWGCR
jgi:hypothetical protein